MKPVIFNRPALRATILSVLLAVVAGCGSETAGPTAPPPSAAPAATSAVSVATTVPPATRVVTTTTLPPTTTTTVPPRPPLPGALEEQVNELTARVEQLRGRKFPSLPLVVTQPAAEAPPTVPEDYERAFLDLFNLLPPEADLESFYRSFQTGRTPELPFYQAERGRVVIPLTPDPPQPAEEAEAGEGEEPPDGEEDPPPQAQPEGEGEDAASPEGAQPEGEGEGLDGLDEYQQWALAGALTRMLAHLHYPETVEEHSALAEDGDPDRAAAVGALLAGEAALVQTLYADALPEERRAALAEQAAADARPGFAQGPPFLAEQARFATAAGSALALHLYRQEGTTGLDRALAAPPVSTEQVLHPDLYNRMEPPVPLEPFAVALEGYETAEEGTWGERGWRALLGGGGRFAQAADAARGWGGDRFQLLWNPERGHLVWAVRYRGDSFADASRMAAALVDLVGGLPVGISTLSGTTLEWPGGDVYALLGRQGETLTLVVADDAEAGRRAAAQMRAEE